MIQVKSLKPGTREWYEQAVRLSIYTNARAQDTDVLPDPNSQDKQGCWGDIFLASGEQRGSRLYLLDRSTLDQTTVNEADSMLNECLAWMKPRWAKKIDITVARSGNYLLVFGIVIWISDKNKISVEINYVVQ